LRRQTGQMDGQTIRVLLVEDNPGDARLISRVLNASENPRFELQQASTLREGMAFLSAGDPDVVLLDLNLPDAKGLDGVSKITKAAPNTPVIVLTGLDAPQTVLETIKVGVRDYFVKSRIEPVALLEAVLRQAARKRQLQGIPAQPEWMSHHPDARAADGNSVRVLIVEDNAGDLAILRRMLAAVKPARFETVHVPRLSSALDALRQSPDIVLLDLNLPDSQDLDTLRRLRKQDTATPVIILTGTEDRQTAVEALANGAQDYLVKGQVDGQLLGRAILRCVKQHASRNGAQKTT
jgi:DNA-binding response OmpR family regulator